MIIKGQINTNDKIELSEVKPKIAKKEDMPITTIAVISLVFVNIQEHHIRTPITLPKNPKK